jgi:hypothetical protein
MNTFSGLSSRIIRLNFHETNNATLTDLPCHGFRPQLPLPVGNTYRGTRNGIGSSHETFRMADFDAHPKTADYQYLVG